MEYRHCLGLDRFSSLPALKLAAYLNVLAIGPKDIPDIPQDVLELLLGEGSNVWSAATLPAGDQNIIIYNTSHADTRQESDLMHELAHLVCEHKPGRIEPPGKFPWALRSFDPDQEEEAEWLGSCLQIPREAILFLVRRGYSNDAIGTQFGASEDMVRFRRNMTGVDRQLARGARWVRSSGRVPA